MTLALLERIAGIMVPVLAMVAERWNREPGKVAANVLVGNTASVVFVPIGLALGLR